MKKEKQLRESIKARVRTLLESVEENAPEIEQKLEEVRQELLKAGRIVDYGGAKNHRAARPECRIPIETVSNLIDVPVNELMLYFLNGQRNKYEQCMVEYSQRNVLFYGPRYEHASEDQFDYND